MGGTGILIETENGEVKDTSLGVMAAASGNEIVALMLDFDPEPVKDILAGHGAAIIVNITSGQDMGLSPDIPAQALADAVKAYELDALIGTASSVGKDLIARVAAILEQPMVSDCLKINIAEKQVEKSHFSGKTVATLKVEAKIFICTIRPNVYDPLKKDAAGEIIEFGSASPDTGLLKIIETKVAKGGKLDLTEAPVIITGGRAINSAENFSMLEACAEKLGAAVGASRSAVDAGYAPHTMQVGQTGKTVSPRLYIACGVSGAVQHFAGMKTSKVIVAINEDKDAPIFSKCDYGIVGDIFEVVPALTEKL